MDIKSVEIIIKSQRLNSTEDHKILEIKDGQAKYYVTSPKEYKVVDATEKEIETFLKVAETVEFFDLEDSYGVNLNLGEGALDVPMLEWVSIKTGEKKKMVTALFCGSHTPGPYNTVVWEAIKYGQAKERYNFF